MKRKLRTICIVCLLLGVCIIPVKAANHSVETEAGIRFTESNVPKEREKPLKKNDILPGGEKPDGWDPYDIGGSKKAYVKSGKVLPQTGDSNGLFLSFLGSGFTVISVWNMRRRK